MLISGKLFMFKANNEMHRILSYFVSCDLRLEIKSAERTVAASLSVEFWIKIIDTARLLID